MTDNYAKLVKDNLDKLYSDLSPELASQLPGEKDGNSFFFKAFGEKCRISPEGITIENTPYSSILGILISLYALNACPDVCIETPLKSFKELPDSMPYVGAFATHTEQVLVPYVDKIKSSIDLITEAMDGKPSTEGASGDFSFMVYPMPKIALCYIFYEADEDFPASVTCLYSNNAHLFLPIDGLADIGEYTSRKIISLIK